MSEPSSSVSSSESVQPPAKSASMWEDFIDIFYAPSQVFARRANSGFGIPLLVVSVLVGIIFIANSGVMQPMMDAEFNRSIATAMKKNPSITPEQMATGRAIGEKVAKVGAFIATPIVVFFAGLALWLVGKLVDAREHLSQALMVASYAYIPKVVEGILTGVQAMLMDPAALNGRYKLSLGVGRFLDPDTASPILLALVGRLDIFTIWVTVLLAIGLSVTGKIPRSRAAVAAAIVWLLGALPGLIQALRS